MSNFKQEKAYQAKGDDVFFDDGREIALLHAIYSSPDLESKLRNNPSAVLSAIDDYARTSKYLMNVGEDKGRIVTDLIKENKPTTMVELGGYIGYSTILFASAMKEAGGTKYLSFERNPEFAAVISSLVDLAGLRDVVQVVVGSSDTGIKRMHKEGVLKKIDFMFLDHYKPAYTTDLKLCEELGLVGPGSVYAADNCIEPGNPPYVEYVSASCEEKKKMASDQRAKGGWDERMAASAVGQYNRREGMGKADENVKGVPELVYESKMVESFEPTGEKDGVMVTRCVGDERKK